MPVSSSSDAVAAELAALRAENAALRAAQVRTEQVLRDYEAREAERTQALREARAEAEQQRDNLRRLFAQAPALVNTQRGPEHVFDLVHPLTYQLLGHRPLVGLASRVALPELEGPFHELLDRVYATGEPYIGRAVHARLDRHNNGEKQDVYFDFTYQPLLGPDGEVEGVMTFAVEVTEQVLARQLLEDSEARLRATNTQLTRTNVDLDNFIYTASHDLRTPITNIEGLLDMLHHQLGGQVAASPELAEVLYRMYDSVTRFKRTIGYLSDVVKLQKEHEPPTTRVALQPVVDDVLLDLQRALAETQAQLHVDVSACPDVLFPQKYLRSVVFNLLSNALKYRHPDRAPQVRLTCQPAGEFARLTVQDNGLGLSAQQQGELFTMFRRLHTHIEGTGIGLYMVKRSVDNAGGRIEVSSEPGVGTTFAVYFRR